jgi:hypothetical protein
MTFCQWSSVLECQHSICVAYASTLLDELVSESNGNEKSILCKETAMSIAAPEAVMSALFCWSLGMKAEMTGVSTDNSTSKIDELLGNVGQVYDEMEIGMGDNSTPQEERLLVQNLSENDAVMYFCFQKVHRQEVAEKL